MSKDQREAGADKAEPLMRSRIRQRARKVDPVAASPRNLPRHAEGKHQASRHMVIYNGKVDLSQDYFHSLKVYGAITDVVHAVHEPRSLNINLMDMKDEKDDGMVVLVDEIGLNFTETNLLTENSPNTKKRGGIRSQGTWTKTPKKYLKKHETNTENIVGLVASVSHVILSAISSRQSNEITCLESARSASEHIFLPGIATSPHDKITTDNIKTDFESGVDSFESHVRSIDILAASCTDVTGEESVYNHELCKKDSGKCNDPKLCVAQIHCREEHIERAAQKHENHTEANTSLAFWDEINGYFNFLSKSDLDVLQPQQEKCIPCIVENCLVVESSSNDNLDSVHDSQEEGLPTESKPSSLVLRNTRLICDREVQDTSECQSMFTRCQHIDEIAQAIDTKTTELTQVSLLNDCRKLRLFELLKPILRKNTFDRLLWDYLKKIETEYKAISAKNTKKYCALGDSDSNGDEGSEDDICFVHLGSEFAYED